MPILSRRTHAPPTDRVNSRFRDPIWPSHWLLYETPPASGLDNMALDLALVRRAAAEDRAVLRLYAWTRPTISFGRNEATRGRWALPSLDAAGYDVVRRPTGGRALLHQHEVTWSVTMPVRAEVPWRDVYDAVNARLVHALRTVGVNATLFSAEDARRVAPNGALCFDAPSVGEIRLGDRKLAGSAVWRADGGYLQHGSILLRDVQHKLRELRPGDPHRQPDPRHAESAAPDTHVLHDVSAEQLREGIRASWSCDDSAVQSAANDHPRNCDISVFEPSTEDIAAHATSRRELSSHDWLWRR